MKTILMKYRFVLVALLASICSYAQIRGVESPYVWKKVVSREIEFGGTITKEKDKSGKVKKPVTLAKMMADVIGSGKAIGYSNLDMTLATRLNNYELDDILGRREDRIEIVDPITGKVAVKVIKRDVDYSIIDRYRILEEWTFDPITCKTQVQILGIAPVRNIYGDDGVFRGVQGMFWLHYNEVKPVIDKYDMLHPDNTVSNAIWSDNFSRTVNRASNDRKCFATRILEILPKKEDAIKHHYKEQMMPEPFTLFLYQAKYMSKVPSWGDFNQDFITSLEPEGIADESLIQVDTMLISDPVTNQEMIKVGKHIYDPQEHRIKAIEQWSFEAQSGTTEIKLIGVGPVKEINNNDKSVKLQPLFWIRYSDAREMIAQNDAYDPGNGLEMTLWSSYFLSDVKPEMMK